MCSERRTISKHIPFITSNRMYTPYFKKHTPYHKVYPLAQVIECIPPISKHISPIECIPPILKHIPPIECIPPISKHIPLSQVYPLVQVIECIPQHISPIESMYTPYRMYTSYFKTHTPSTSDRMYTP